MRKLLGQRGLNEETTRAERVKRDTKICIRYLHFSYNRAIKCFLQGFNIVKTTGIKPANVDTSRDVLVNC